jgi:hypothetical protein
MINNILLRTLLDMSLDEHITLCDSEQQFTATQISLRRRKINSMNPFHRGTHL